MRGVECADAGSAGVESAGVERKRRLVSFPASVSGQVRTTRGIDQHGSTAMKRVSLFTMANCPHCKTAKQYLEQQKIGFRLVDVKSPAGQKEFAKTGFRSVPVLKIGDQFLKGFSVKGFNQLYKE
ncbi:glutaredoxin family protein [Cobetia sp. QF-1]|uniref:glutaredoxin family protein n=1 Tax=Cobetia sp. QF-1 TaxID=1969833 RepID=UPI001C3D3B84|nr:glutaredoxin family protein [Cobetia sp. QF-1]